MLPAKPDPLRIALNRVTFGARDADVVSAATIGWQAWVTQQLAAPAGDDPDLAAHIAAQTMPIAYAAPNPATQPNGSWTAVNEARPLNYLNASVPDLYYVATHAGREVANAERTRIRQEVIAATWIRNAHSRYQLREFMTDFWHNHFNVGKNENETATALLPHYDKVAIRPHVFGNFRAMLEANATSPTMLIYLDNYLSTASTPNENYAREIMELHTLGRDAYLGVGATGTVPLNEYGVASGFTDQDVIQASRALSGWTIARGQRVGLTTIPNTGEFIYNSAQHNLNAGMILGNGVGHLTAPQAQGHRLLDLIAAHPATARFICTKLLRRIFGDSLPAAVLARAIEVWMDTQSEPDQIAQVLRSILLDRAEIFDWPVAKIRRPYERLIALFRTTDTIVNAAAVMTNVMDPVNDVVFAWQAPNGRPDVNDYWLGAGAILSTWNIMLQAPNWPQTRANLAAQTPRSAVTPTEIIEYWLGRMIGGALPAISMNALVADQSGNNGVAAARATNNAGLIENAHRRLVSLIATTEQFTLR